MMHQVQWSWWRWALVVAAVVLAAGQTVRAAGPDDWVDELWLPAIADSTEGRLVEKVADGWARLFIADDYLPPPGCKYVFLPGATDRTPDMVRKRYAVTEGIVTLTQTQCIFAVLLDVAEPAAGANVTVVRRAESLMRKVLRCEGDLTLVAQRTDGDRTKGMVETKERSAEKQWLNHVQWWAERTKVGVYFVKNDGHPSQATRGTDIELNGGWFKKIGKPKTRR